MTKSTMQTVIDLSTSTLEYIGGLNVDGKFAELKTSLREIEEGNVSVLQSHPTTDLSAELQTFYTSMKKGSKAAIAKGIVDATTRINIELIKANLELEEWLDENEPDTKHSYEMDADEEESSVPLLVELEHNIANELNSVAHSFILIGNWLVEARDEFETMKEFLVWAEENFSIKKSQVYSLMNISKEFGKDARFVGVPMRVLNMFCGATEEVKDKAAELAKTGTLNSPAAKSLIIEEAGGLEEDSEPEEEFDLGVSTEVVLKSSQITPTGIESPVDATSNDTALQALQDIIDSLRDQLLELGKPKRFQTLPMLPHFESELMYVRLGLPANFTVADIRDAYRKTVKHYSEDANKEAFDLLTEAKDALINALIKLL